MSLAANISPYLPYLRRFSRALTGSQKSGDAYVAALLEALIADPASLGETPNIRVSLYRMYCRLWGSITLNLKQVNGEGGRPQRESPRWAQLAEKRLAHIDPPAREAFLLMAVEGFTIPEIAVILGTDEASARQLIDQAAKSIVDQVATTVLIIEDEPVIAMDIKSILGNLGHKVTGIARTRQQAVHLAGARRPGLVLADIQLADGSSGIDAVNQILSKTEVPVVFITAYPERLLTGERPEPAFLITKPFTPEMVRAVVSQALFFDTKARAAA